MCYGSMDGGAISVSQATCTCWALCSMPSLHCGMTRSTTSVQRQQAPTHPCHVPAAPRVHMCRHVSCPTLLLPRDDQGDHIVQRHPCHVPYVPRVHTCALLSPWDDQVDDVVQGWQAPTHANHRVHTCHTSHACTRVRPTYRGMTRSMTSSNASRLSISSLLVTRLIRSLPTGPTASTMTRCSAALECVASLPPWGVGRGAEARSGLARCQAAMQRVASLPPLGM